jgi:hypothetical protein
VQNAAPEEVGGANQVQEAALIAPAAEMNGVKKNGEGVGVSIEPVESCPQKLRVCKPSLLVSKIDCCLFYRNDGRFIKCGERSLGGHSWGSN